MSLISRFCRSVVSVLAQCFKFKMCSNFSVKTINSCWCLQSYPVYQNRQQEYRYSIHAASTGNNAIANHTIIIIIQSIHRILVNHEQYRSYSRIEKMVAISSSAELQDFETPAKMALSVARSASPESSGKEIVSCSNATACRNVVPVKMLLRDHACF